MRLVQYMTFLFFLGLPTSASGITLEELQQRLSLPTLIRGEFKQRRKIAILSEELHSSGHFVLSKHHGLMWIQDRPFKLKLSLNKDILTQQFKDQKRQRISARENPTLFYFSRIFLAVFRGDTHRLKKHFRLNLVTDKKTWKLRLSPKTSPINKMFKEIT
ncbi:MAG: outer membrane lipoprotein carrier protein LolA, partial [bacterium]|nr:outer membrane lipoprotein carrier protein LolA [bacterium]